MTRNWKNLIYTVQYLEIKYQTEIKNNKIYYQPSLNYTFMLLVGIRKQVFYRQNAL